MIIKLSDETGFIKPYFLQTLITLYLPCEKFSETEQGNREFYVSLQHKEGAFSAFVRLCDGQNVSQKSVCEMVETVNKQKAIILVGKAFLSAANELFGYIPPWGAMTGIRPAKNALFFMNAGMNEEQTIRFLTEEYFVEQKKAEICTKIALHEKKIIQNLERNSCSLYISIPFCPTRCRYCSFVTNSTDRLLALIPQYLQQLKADLFDLSQTISSLGLMLKSIYVGGGTPTVLNASQIEDLLSFVQANFDFKNVTEYTFEAGRPDTVTREKLEVLKQFSVDRISINTQSTNNDVLKRIGRNHTYEAYRDAYELAREVGFRSINTDLIAGLPGEEEASFRKSLTDVIFLAPENITIHSFSLKRASEFLSRDGATIQTENSVMNRMLDYSYDKLEEFGYLPYYIYRQKNTAGNLENTGFSKAGHESSYNVLIMEEYHTIFAAGAGAVTKLVSSDRTKIDRIFSPKYPYEYLDKEKYSGFDTESIINFYQNKF